VRWLRGLRTSRERKHGAALGKLLRPRAKKFIEAQGDYTDQAGEALAIISDLYEVEREAKDTGPPESLAERRAKLRREKSTPLMAKLQAWAIAQRALAQSSIGKALSYLHEQWRRLQAYLDDPKVDIDNNATERALRGVVVGRKNHYGSKSQRGTEVALCSTV
jgi:transposase